MIRLLRRRSSLPLILIGVGLIVFSLAVVIVSIKENQPRYVDVGVEPVPAVVDFSAPELVLSDLSGRLVSLSNLRGQVILVNNWATWCPPCRVEMPALEAYSQAHGQDNFVLIGINAGDTEEQVRNFIKEYHLTFPVWLDPSSKALRAFKSNALPSSYVIDRTGTVRLVWNGTVTLEVLEAYITPLLAD